MIVALIYLFILLVRKQGPSLDGFYLKTVTAVASLVKVPKNIVNDRLDTRSYRARNKCQSGRKWVFSGGSHNIHDT